MNAMVAVLTRLSTKGVIILLSLFTIFSLAIPYSIEFPVPTIPTYINVYFSSGLYKTIVAIFCPLLVGLFIYFGFSSTAQLHDSFRKESNQLTIDAHRGFIQSKDQLDHYGEGIMQKLKAQVAANALTLLLASTAIALSIIPFSDLISSLISN